MQVNVRVKAQFFHILSLIYLVLPPRIVAHQPELFPHHFPQLTHHFLHLFLPFHSHQQNVAIMVSYFEGTDFLSIDLVVADFHVALGFDVSLAIYFLTIIIGLLLGLLLASE